LGSDGVQRGHDNVYWLERNVPMSSGEMFMLLALGFVIGVINSRERDKLLSLCVLRLNVSSWSRRIVIPQKGTSSSLL
jgi:hypothetical protein